MKAARLALFGQGAFYVSSGLWPLVSLSTFETVTGPKTDDWLVQTVGVLAMVIGGALLFGVRRAEPRAETLVLAALSAIGFAAVDLVFGLSGTISPIYLLDAAVEVVFAAAAIVALRATSGSE